MSYMRELLCGSAVIVCGATLAAAAPVGGAFRVLPYLQNPAKDAMTVMWLSDSADAGSVTATADGETVSVQSTVRRAPELAYHPSEAARFFDGKAPAAPYIHRATFSGLKTGARYQYAVNHGGETYRSSFGTAPGKDSAVRFIVYADSETEPESTGKTRRWSQPQGDFNRQYVVDQTVGYAENIKIMKARRPDFIAVAGDLVESGNEQRDWDEFWAHNAGKYNNIASSTPIIAALGNHENYPGPNGGGTYSNAVTPDAVARFKAYFDAPDNGATDPNHKGRYHRTDYGPISFITIDSSNGAPNGGDKDTNFFVDASGEDRDPNIPGAGIAPDFNPGSEQYKWLERQLADAKANSKFTFVQFHHTPYSVGPHGYPAGKGGQANGEDSQSGVPMRVLSPLFEKYGVSAVFSGHDEMYEHSLVNGIHYFDTGIGGDGLRGPYFGEDGRYPSDLKNPYQKFLAHLDAPEVWDGDRLVSGGKHYGHVEVNVEQDAKTGKWLAKIIPTIAFPLMDKTGAITGWERRTYNDVTTLTATAPVPLPAGGALLLGGLAGFALIRRKR